MSSSLTGQPPPNYKPALLAYESGGRGVQHGKWHPDHLNTVNLDGTPKVTQDWKGMLQIILSYHITIPHISSTFSNVKIPTTTNILPSTSRPSHCNPHYTLPDLPLLQPSSRRPSSPKQNETGIGSMGKSSNGGTGDNEKGGKGEEEGGGWGKGGMDV